MKALWNQKRPDVRSQRPFINLISQAGGAIQNDRLSLPEKGERWWWSIRPSLLTPSLVVNRAEVKIDRACFG